MVLAVSRRPLTVEARAQPLASLFVDNGEISCTGTGFTVQFFGFPLSALFNRSSMPVHSFITGVMLSQKLTVSFNDTSTIAEKL
jgi:hypothetical protein